MLAAIACALSVSAVCDAAMGAVSAVSGEYRLNVTGLCPGSITIEWSGASPNGRQGILVGRAEGKFTIPEGVCEGTALGITDNVALAIVISTRDGSGAVSGTGGQVCRRPMQLIEGGTCRTSNVARMP